MSEERAAQLEEDRLLVDRARTGDTAAFSSLMERYQHRAYAVALGMVHSREDALDVVQDAFIKAHRHLDRFQGQSSFYTWLYRIVVNLCIDLRRRRARAKTDPLDETMAHDQDLAGELDVSPHRHTTQPLQNAQNNELGKHLQAALDGLSDNHRTILLLREVEGLSYEELAQVLGISKGTVMSRLFHARQNMQRLLRPALGLPDGTDLSGRRESSGADETGDPEQQRGTGSTPSKRATVS